MRKQAGKNVISMLLATLMILAIFTGLMPAAAAEAIAEIPFAAEALTLTPGSTESDMNFTWYSDSEDNTASLVQIAEKSDMINEEFPVSEAITETGTTGDASAGKSWHKAGVSGLKPGTEYIYRVSNDGISFSQIYNFKTAKASSFTFAVTGDPQLTTGSQDSTSNYRPDGDVGTTAQGWKETMSAIAGFDVDFVAGVGDQVDTTNNGSEAEYANFFAPDEMKNIPYAPAIGNHDRHYLFNYHYNLPNVQSFTPVDNAGNAGNQQYKDMEVAGNYYYMYNNALFVVLNDSGYPESKEIAAQYIALFDQTLNTATQAHAGEYDWLFVQHHKSTASLADHCADLDIQYYVEAGFEKTMDKYGVDFVLAGHDHVYARSYPMFDGVPDKTGASGESNVTLTQGGDGADFAVNPGGTVYFTMTTGSGLKYYELFNNANNLYVKDNAEYPYLIDGKVGSVAYMEGNIPLSTAKYLQNKTPGFLLVTVEGNEVSFAFHDLSETYLNTPFDTYTVTKVDVASYTVTFDADNGTETFSVTVTDGEKVANPGGPVREGFTFLGWYNGDVGFDFDTIITSDIILTAKWAPVPAVTLVSVTPSAFVTKLSGNKNDLTITITEEYSDGTTDTVTVTFSIANNAADIYTVGAYRVYVDTKGNDQIRELSIVE